MLVAILVTIFLTILLLLFVLIRTPKQSRIYFVGPHSSGKTAAMLSLSEIPKKTVTTLADHEILFKGKNIIEIVANDNKTDFIDKFRLNSEDTYIFFMKNEQEIDSYPDLNAFKIKFVVWQKTNEITNNNIIYLQESKDKLAHLIMSL